MASKKNTNNQENNNKENLSTQSQVSQPEQNTVSQQMPNVPSNAAIPKDMLDPNTPQPPSPGDNQQRTLASTENKSVNQADSGNVKVKLSGVLKGEKWFPKGTKLSDAIKEFTNSGANKFDFTDQNGKPVGHTRALHENIECTVTEKAKGG